MKTKVDICNMALGYLGISATIADFDEASTEARVCRTFFDSARDLALEEMPWPFSERTNALQIVSGDKQNWLYRYRYPNDCLFAREMTAEGLVVSGIRLHNTIPFKIVEDEIAGGKAILCNIANAVLVYTARIESTEIYPMAFVVALSLGLAAMIGAPLSASTAVQDKAAEAYAKAILKASARSFNEGHELEEPLNELTASRQ